QRISREISDKEIWVKLVKLAYQSSYGYEFQGDSLLLARENLFATFDDYYQEKFGQVAEKKIRKEIARIISYNVMQMDGLLYTSP
ncbi:Eco57I restriction-modification methylase domain-containing protein, partial [Streptococcus pyogenes]